MSDMLTVRLHVQFREDGVGKAWLEAESLGGMWHTTPIKLSSPRVSIETVWPGPFCHPLKDQVG